MTDREKLEKIKELADAMYHTAQYLTTDASRLHKAMEEYHKFITNEYHIEEPVSNPIDFEKELYKAFGQVKDFTLGMRIARWFYDMGKNSQEPVSEDLENAALMHFKDVMEYENKNGLKMANMTSFKAGANWQKSKDAKLIFNAKDDGYRLGLATMKQQLLAKAVDAVVKIDAGGYPYVDRIIELYDYDKDVPLAKRGDKVKILVIKED